MSDIVSLLSQLNPHIPLYSIENRKFSRYGVCLENMSAQCLRRISIHEFPYTGGTNYVASSLPLEKCNESRLIGEVVFGEMEIQAGLCWGDNSAMNGMEYHKSSEVLVAVTHFVLILGYLGDVTSCGWDSRKAECFYVPLGTFLELYSTTLHLAPCRVDNNPFYAVVLLPKGTNTPLASGPSGMLWMRNKWLLAHQENPVSKKGAAVKIAGENIKIIPIL